MIQRAKIARATFYDLFEGRDDAVDWACLLAVQTLLEPVQRAVEEGESAQERVARAIDAFVRAAIAEPRLAELCLVHSQAFFPRRAERHEQPLVATLGFAIDGVRPRPFVKIGCTSFGELWAYGVLAVTAQRLVDDKPDSLLALVPDLTALALAPAGQT